jgi:hypothetical protein
MTFIETDDVFKEDCLIMHAQKIREDVITQAHRNMCDAVLIIPPHPTNLSIRHDGIANCRQLRIKIYVDKSAMA